MIAKLINPFRYIAGGKSLIAGVLILLATACIGFLSNTHFPDIVSVKIGADFPIWYFVIQSLSDWIVFSLILYLCAVILSPSSVRAVDVFGTQALARSPYLIASFTGFSDSLDVFAKYVLWKNLQIGEPISLLPGTAVIAVSLMVLSLILTVWLVTLMYNAFKVSANLKGVKLNVTFIIVFVVSIIITSLITKYLINIFS